MALLVAQLTLSVKIFPPGFFRPVFPPGVSGRLWIAKKKTTYPKLRRLRRSPTRPKEGRLGHPPQDLLEAQMRGLGHPRQKQAGWGTLIDIVGDRKLPGGPPAGMRVYGYVVMPEHVHLLLSEPERGTLADVMHLLKLSSAKRVRLMRSKRGEIGSLWQKRYYDRNLRSHDDFVEKLRYIHRNPVKRGLVANPEDWKWSSFAHYALGMRGAVEVESEWTALERTAGQAKTQVSAKERREPGAPGERWVGSPKWRP